MKRGLLVLGCALLSLLLVANAHAATVNQLLFYDEQNLLSDNSAEFLLNRQADGTYVTDNNDFVINVGDRLRGVFEIKTIEGTSSGGLNVLGRGTVNDEWSGLFDIVIFSKTATATPGIFDFVMAPSGALAAYGGPNVMLAMFEDATPDYSRIFNASIPGPDDVPGAVQEGLLVATATDGIFYWSGGMTGAPNAAGYGPLGEFWVATGPDDVSLGGPLATNAGTVNMGLRLTANNIGPRLGLVPALNPLTGVTTFQNMAFDGNIVSPGTANTPYDVFDDVNATILPIPEPAAMLLFGTALVGAAVFGKRKFKRN